MFGIIPRDAAFFDLFEKATETLIAAASSYRVLVVDGGDRESGVARIRQLERQGDETVRQTLERLDRTFITPFDREDIQSLMNLLDDVIDDIDAASKRLSLYRISEVNSWLVQQSEVLLQACQAIGTAVGKLRNLKKPQALREHLREVHRLENLGDDQHHAAVAELYDAAGDAILVMKWKEIFELTEHAIDCCEDVANVIEAIVLKNT